MTLRSTLPLWTALLWLTACEAGDSDGGTDTDDGPSSACGETTRHDLTISGLVEDSSGAPVEGATVTLDDRGYDHEDKGESITDASGAFTLEATDVASVEDCWGTLLDYWLIASTEDGLEGEKSVNSYLLNAIEDGSNSADISSFPVVVE